MNDELKQLGNPDTEYGYTVCPDFLETFPNPKPERDYTICFKTNEVTSLCPMTGQPDFYSITIEYIPDHRCLESKALKLYLFSFRQSGLFAEDMANRMLEDLVAACKPRWMRIKSSMRPRGGIGLSVEVTHPAPQK